MFVTIVTLRACSVKAAGYLQNLSLRAAKSICFNIQIMDKVGLPVRVARRSEFCNHVLQF